MTISNYANRIGAKNRIKPGRNKGVLKDYREEKCGVAEERQAAYRAEFPNGAPNMAGCQKPGRQLREMLAEALTNH